MPYEFPWRALRTGDVTDPQEMDGDILPAAEKVSGKLNAHDFDAVDIRANVGVGAGAYVSVSHAFRSVNPDYLRNTRPPTIGGAGPDAPWNVPNDLQWHVLDSMTRSVSTGVAVLYVLGWCQYSIQTWAALGALPTTVPTSVQFGIRVDGVLIEWTRTGRREEHLRSWNPLLPSTQKNDATPLAFPGPGALLGGSSHALGPEYRAVRIGCAVPVQPGTHVVDFVARRAPRIGSTAFVSATDYVVIYSRRVVVLNLHQYPQAATSGFSVNVPSFEPGDVLTAAALGTDRLIALRNGYNAVGEGALARGAFRHEHLPSAQRGSGIASFPNTMAIQQSDAQWPGYGNNTMAAGKLINANGWWELDGAGNLRVTNGGGAWTTSSGPILVLGNVHLTWLDSNIGGDVGRQHFGVFTLGYVSGGGAMQVIAATEAGANSSNPRASTLVAITDDWPVDTDVPVMFFHEPADGIIPASVDYFTLLGSSVDADSPNQLSFYYASSSLIVIQLRN